MSYNFSAAMTEMKLYGVVLGFSAAIYAVSYWYLQQIQATGLANKAVADTSIVLIGLSMMLSGLCYFWNVFDGFIAYRKQLGVIGFWFGVVHVMLSSGAAQRLLSVAGWSNGIPWAPLTGMIALVIFLLMTLISNQFMARTLARWWKRILRFGYVAVILVWLHVYFLKAAAIMRWYEAGLQTAPPTSILMLLFMTAVIGLRLLLWFKVRK